MEKNRRAIVIRSRINCPLEQMQGRLFTMRQVNNELAPWIHMSAPEPWANLDIRHWPTGETLFRSTIYLFGLIPVDRHQFGMASQSPSGFREQSRSLLQKSWIHERHIVAEGNRTLITDRIFFTPRLQGLALLLRPIYSWLFKHRHRRLEKAFKTYR